MASTNQTWAGFQDNFNYTSINSMSINGWTQCGQGSNQTYAVSPGALTLQDGAAMCMSNIPAGVSNWTLTFQGHWATNQHPTTGLGLVAKTAHHVYRFAAGEGNGLVVYRDNVIVINSGGWYPYCVVDGKNCYYTDFGAWHHYRFTMLAGVLTAYFDDFVDPVGVDLTCGFRLCTAIGSYKEPDLGTDLVMVSPGSGSDIGVVWSSAFVGPYAQTTAAVSCSPASVFVDQATVCTASVANLVGNEAGPTGTVVFTVTMTCSSGNPPVQWTCQNQIGSCTLANATAALSSCSISYVSTNCPCPYNGFVSPVAHTIGVTYNGDPAHAGSSASVGVILVPLHETSTSVSCNPTTVSAGQVSTCTYAVQDTSPTPIIPTGGVYDGTGKLSCTLLASNASLATCNNTVTGPRTGSLSVVGNYGGDMSHYTSGGGTTLTVPGTPTPPGSVNIQLTITFQGVSVLVSGPVTISSSGTASGAIFAIATNSTNGATLFSKLYTVIEPVTNYRSKFLFNVGVKPYPLSANIILAYANGNWSATVGVTRQLDIFAHGTVDMSDLATIAISLNLGPGNPGYNPTADIVGRGTVDIVDLAWAAMFFGATDYS